MQKQRNPKRLLRRDHNPFLLKIVPQISDLHRFIFFDSKRSVYIREICGTFSSSDFTDESEVILAYRITHGFSQIFGLCSMACARYVLLLSFCHADFADNADFSSWCFFVPQISQINTDLYEIKNLRHLRNLRDKKTPMKKS